MKDLAQFSLRYAEKCGASYAEARLDHSTVHSVSMKNGSIQTASFDDVEGIGMRFIVNKKLGFVSSNKLTKKDLKDAITQAIKTAKATGKQGADTLLAKDSAHKKSYQVKQQQKLKDLSIKERVQLLQEAEAAIKASRVNTPNRFISYTDADTTEHLVTSHGTNIHARIPRMSMYYFLTVVERQKAMQRYWAWGGTGGFEETKKWKVSQLFHDEVTGVHKVLTRGKKSPVGKLPIVVGPQVTGIMVHESVGHPYEADRILGREAAQAGESFITPSMKGFRIGSEQVTIVDDPTVANAYGFYLYDNEGVKAKRKVLMKKGLINEFLHNRETAKTMGTKSNGSSRASEFDKESIVRMSNSFVLPGKWKEQELFSGIKKGIFLKNFMQWNIDDKRLNAKYTGAEAYLIENGEITTPIINPILEVTTKKLWSSVDAVANNMEMHAGNCGKGEPMQGIAVTLGGPSMRLKGLRIK